MSNNVKIHEAQAILQQKAGKGPFDPDLIKKAQEYIEENDVDFTPLGFEFLNNLKNVLQQAETSKTAATINEYQESLIKPVMELKANAAIFHYPLIGDLANIMLDFLESIEILDGDAIEIVKAHHDTLSAIIKNRMKNEEGAQQGAPFVTELKEACARYHRKRSDR